MKKSPPLAEHLTDGNVYRRSDLTKWSSSVDRDLAKLVKDGVLHKLSAGLYHKPTESTFGKTPADEQTLVRAFLKDDDFVVTTPNSYNSLGVGTTQLYNTRRVYNYKRHGRFTLGNRQFEFVRKPKVPTMVTKEFLLVDLVNNLKNLEENQPVVLANVRSKVKELDTDRLKTLVHSFGTVSTKKFFERLLSQDV